MKVPHFVFPMWEKFRASLGELHEFQKPLSAAQIEDQFDRSIRTLNDEIDAGKKELAATKGRRIHAQQMVDRAKASQEQVEELAVDMLRRRKKAGAKLLAEDVSKLAETRCEWAEAVQAEAELERVQAALVAALESRLKRLRYQLGVYRASLNINRTQEALARTGVPAPAPAPSRKKNPDSESPEQVFERLDREAKKPSSSTKRTTKTRKSS